MATLEQHLRARAKKLRPTKSQFDSAERSHLYLQNALNSGQMGARILRSFLSGSYARDTAIRPLDDVDIVFVVDPTAWKRTVVQRFLDAPPSPSKILESLANAVRYRYRQQGLTSRVRVQRRSVGLVMNHLTIDVVPAVQSDDDRAMLLIPDVPSNRWIETGPEVHAAISARVDADCGGMLKPLVRLLKGWNGSLASTVSLKSKLLLHD